MYILERKSNAATAPHEAACAQKLFTSLSNIFELSNLTYLVFDTDDATLRTADAARRVALAAVADDEDGGGGWYVASCFPGAGDEGSRLSDIISNLYSNWQFPD